MITPHPRATHSPPRRNPYQSKRAKVGFACIGEHYRLAMYCPGFGSECVVLDGAFIGENLDLVMIPNDGFTHNDQDSTRQP